MGKLNLTGSKLIENDHKGLFEATLNTYLGTISPKDIIDVKYTKCTDSYSALVIYKK